jgi:hypothetical protein
MDADTALDHARHIRLDVRTRGKPTYKSRSDLIYLLSDLEKEHARCCISCT